MVPITDTVICMTAKMLECRNTMQRYWGNKYPERVRPFREALHRWMRETKMPALKVGAKLIQLAEEHGGGMDAALAICAVVDEISSPSESKEGVA